MHASGNKRPNRVLLATRSTYDKYLRENLAISSLSPDAGESRCLQKREMINTTSRVLLVDDNRDAVDMVSLLLTMHQIDSKVAYDGASALAILAGWSADIVFLDIRMPGMDGYETAIAMHALPGCADLPIVAWTAWDRLDNEESMTNAGMVARLSKPVAKEDILEIIAHYGRRPSYRQERSPGEAPH